DDQTLRDERDMEDAAPLSSVAKGAAADKKESFQEGKNAEPFSLRSKEKSAKKARAEKIPLSGQTVNLLSFSTNDRVRINAIVTNLKGRVIPEKQKDRIKNQQFIFIEIPVKNYSQLLDQLNKDYNVQKPLPKLSPKSQNKARIQLQYQLNQD
ncbi:MAG: hypothetical protein PHF84_04320, partial [bacterium]|nr:hypothetical protein [bacterium]